MLKRLNLVLFAALLVFGATASATTRAYAFDDTRCGGDIRPLCRTRTIERCVAWYPCGSWQRCCQTWERSTVYDYFRSGGGDDWLPEPE